MFNLKKTLVAILATIACLGSVSTIAYFANDTYKGKVDEIVETVKGWFDNDEAENENEQGGEQTPEPTQSETQE